jgi:hypothetical protein
MATTTEPQNESDDPDHYRVPDDKVRPGDIVRLFPAYRSLKAIEVLGAEWEKNSQRNAKLHSIAESPKATREGSSETKLVVPGRLRWGLLLSRGCDVDHTVQRQIAPLRPIQEFNPEDRANIIKGKTIGFHYLPAPPNRADLALGEMVIDFTFITTLHRDLFDTLVRPISLTRDTLHYVYLGWMRHTMGRDIPTMTPCPNCGADVEVFHAAAESARPPDDY